MISLRSETTVQGVTAGQIIHFMLHCNDQKYRNWWPETHFRFHTINPEDGYVGSLVYFDELIGKRRLKFKAVIVNYIPDKSIQWQLKSGVLLPASVTLECQQTSNGLKITHTLRAGYNSAGRVFDPFIRIYLSKKFEQDLNEHAQYEFQRLSELLRQSGQGSLPKAPTSLKRIN